METRPEVTDELMLPGVQDSRGKLDDHYPEAVETLPLYLYVLPAPLFGDSAEPYNKAWYAFVINNKHGAEVLKNDSKA